MPSKEEGIPPSSFLGQWERVTICLKAPMIKTLLPLFLKLSYLGAVALFLLDFFTYNGAVKNNLGLSPFLAALIVLALHLGIRWKWGKSLGRNFSLIHLLIVAPLALLFALGCYVLEEGGFLFPNYFFVNFKISYPVFQTMALAATGFGIVHIDRQFWQTHWRWLVPPLSLIAIFSAWALFLIDPANYSKLVGEDGWIENLTFLVSLGSSILSFALLRHAKTFSKVMWQRRIFQIGCVLAGIAFFVLAGEEISWGQRLLALETFDSLKEVNRQGEINLHNTEFFWPYIYLGYQLIGLYGALAWVGWWISQEFLTLVNTKKKQLLETWKELLVPGGHLFFLFGLIVVYVWLRQNHGPWKYQPWEEFSELLLFSGILIHLASYFSQLRAKTRKK